MQKAHNLPQSWIDGCSAEPEGLTRWIEAHKNFHNHCSQVQQLYHLASVNTMKIIKQH